MKRVLVAPLDWGLGHATRCIPIIQELQRRKCEVFLAGSGDSLALLNAEFPDLKSFTLPGYNPVYPSSGSMVWKMALQLPKFNSIIKAEHQYVERLVPAEKIDCVISDNRYGCWSSKVYSVFITHQSNILMPKRFGWLQDFVRRINHRLMKNFSVCWIPDVPGKGNLAGSLISFGEVPKDLKVEFIGYLSRFKPSISNAKLRYTIAAIFSGPEPQRTLMEKTVLPQLEKSGLSYFVVKGIPTGIVGTGKENVVNFLTTHDLQQLIESSEIILARSGYSTVMDLRALGKKAIFIPTPGQTEQQYLARSLKSKGISFYMDQDQFDLQTAIKESEMFQGFVKCNESENNLLSNALDKIMLLE